jgi:hypothetical protein
MEPMRNQERETGPVELTSAEWAKADAIARELAVDVDRNELGKIVAYAHRAPDVAHILDLVERLPQTGYVRSSRTKGYLQRIGVALRRELKGLEGRRALAVLCWAFRLMTMYQTEQGTRTADGRKRMLH